MEKGNMLTTFIDGVKAVGRSVAEGFKTFFSNFVLINFAKELFLSTFNNSLFFSK